MIHISFKTFDLDPDPDMESLLVTGTIGASCSKNAPYQIRVGKLFLTFSLIEKAKLGDLEIPVGRVA